jgi:hypothetical protein
MCLVVMVERRIRPERTMDIPKSVFCANVSTVPPDRIDFYWPIPDTSCLANFQLSLRDEA